MKTTSDHFDTSLRKLPWSTDEITPVQTLISSTLEESYLAKHRVTSKQEYNFINSIKPKKCRYCGSTSFIRCGHRNGLNVYKCKDCNRKFTNLTNIIFDSKKISISEWIEFLIHLFEYHSIVSSSRDNRNSSSTDPRTFF